MDVLELIAVLDYSIALIGVGIWIGRRTKK